MLQRNFAERDTPLRVSVFLATKVFGGSECTSCFQSCCSQDSFKVALGTLAMKIASEVDQKGRQVAPAGEQFSDVLFCHCWYLKIIARPQNGAGQRKLRMSFSGFSRRIHAVEKPSNTRMRATLEVLAKSILRWCNVATTKQKSQGRFS